MLRWAVETSIKFRLLVAALAAGLLALGVIQLQDARVDALPEFTPPYVEIQTEALGLSAAEVEQLITVPLEADLLNGVALLDAIRSSSVPAVVDRHGVRARHRPLDARQLVQERMTQAHALPNVSKPPVDAGARLLVQPGRWSSGCRRRRLSLIEQSVLARWTIRPRLMGVPGRGQRRVFGERDRQLQVQVDPQRLRDQGVTLSEVIRDDRQRHVGLAADVPARPRPRAPAASSTRRTSGCRCSTSRRSSTPPRSPTGARSRAARGAPRSATSPRWSRTTSRSSATAIVDDGRGLMIVIEKFPDANTLEVTRGVEAALRELAPAWAGCGSTPPCTGRRATSSRRSATMGLTLLIGLALAALLTAALFSWRAAVTGLVTVARRPRPRSSCSRRSA